MCKVMPRQRGIATIFLSLGLMSAPTWAQTDPFANATHLRPQALVAAVLDGNPSLAAAESDWQAAQSRIVPAAALDDPMLSMTAAPESFGIAGMSPGMGVELSQRLPWPGKRGLQESIARFEARAVKQSIANTRLDLTELAKEAFADWYLVHAGLRVNEANRKLWKDVRGIAEIGYANGTGSKQDVLQADIEYQMLGHRQVVLERQRAEILAQLNRLLNRHSDDPLPPPAAIGEPVQLQPLIELRAAALTHRTELEAAEAELKADSARVDLARREFYPDFQVSTGYNSMWGDRDMRWTVGFGINIPLGREKRHAAVSGARAEEMASRWRLQDLSLVIVKDIDRAHARVQETRHLLSLHEARLLPLARENLAAARTAYRARTGSLQSLLRAERSLFDIELNYEAARADHYRNIAALERAVGGWDQSLAGQGNSL